MTGYRTGSMGDTAGDSRQEDAAGAIREGKAAPQCPERRKIWVGMRKTQKNCCVW